MFWLFIGYFLLCILPFSYAQHSNKHHIDSLINALKNTGEDTNRVKILLDLSYSNRCNDSINMLEYANTALQLAQKINWPEGIYNAHYQLGLIYQVCFSYDRRAVDHYLKMQEISTGIANKQMQSAAFDVLGNFFKNVGEYKRSLEYYKQNITLYKELGKDMQSLLGNIGTVYATIGDYAKALDCYQQSLKIAEQSTSHSHEDSLTIPLLLTTIGEVYLSMAQYDKALANYDSALKQNESLKSKDLAKIIFIGLGNIYKKKGNYTEAIKNYEACLRVCEDRNDKRMEADILNQLAVIYITANNIPKAMQYAQQSLVLAQNANNGKTVCDIYITLGKIYALQKQYDLSVSYLKNALAIAEKSGLLENESDAWNQLSYVYKQQNQPGKALEAFQNYISIRDSIYSQENAKAITRMEMQGDFDKKQLSDSLKQDIARNALNLKLQRQEILTNSGFAGLLLLVLVSFLIFRNYNHEKKANAIIKTEKEKSDELLLNILPAEVAEELKLKGNVQAHQYDTVTVMFTDFVNFTAAGERLGAEQLVNELDNCFVAFDQIIAKYNIEKIKTVGDAYLAVSGLPLANREHAYDLVKAAVEIRDHMLKRRQELGDKTFELRVGIHSGPVVAGIVGVKKFAYDIWGDTVNIAARMEQSSYPGKINISEATHELVKHDFNFTYRGEVDAKNKGRMKMYFVEAPTNSPNGGEV